MIWFTADHHFGHKNIIKYCNRPFGSVEEMDSEMIRRWNVVVGADDTVYHLGDFTLNDAYFFNEISNRLNGRILILPGSHDNRWLSEWKDGVSYYSNSKHPIVILPPLYSVEIPTGEKYPLVISLCHYPMLTWDRSFHGSYHLFGHEHGRVNGVGKSMDVGVDCHSFAPISLDEVLLVLKHK